MRDSQGHSYITVSSEVLEQLDLPKGALSEDLLAEYIGDFLDGDAVARLVVHGSAIRRRWRQSLQPASDKRIYLWKHTYQTIP